MGDYSKAFELGVEKGRRAGRMCSAGAHACLQATARRTHPAYDGLAAPSFFHWAPLVLRIEAICHGAAPRRCLAEAAPWFLPLYLAPPRSV